MLPDEPYCVSSLSDANDCFADALFDVSLVPLGCNACSSASTTANIKERQPDKKATGPLTTGCSLSKSSRDHRATAVHHSRAHAAYILNLQRA
jgi:hypothetical protein